MKVNGLRHEELLMFDYAMIRLLKLRPHLKLFHFVINQISCTIDFLKQIIHNYVFQYYEWSFLLERGQVMNYDLFQ